MGELNTVLLLSRAPAVYTGCLYTWFIVEITFVQEVGVCLPPSALTYISSVITC